MMLPQCEQLQVADRSINGSSSEQLAKEGTGYKNGLSVPLTELTRPSAARAHSSASAAVVATRSGGFFYPGARHKPSEEERGRFNIQVRLRRSRKCLRVGPGVLPYWTRCPLCSPKKPLAIPRPA